MTSGKCGSEVLMSEPLYIMIVSGVWSDINSWKFELFTFPVTSPLDLILLICLFLFTMGVDFLSQ